jgi:hypothetical protein
MSWVLILFVSLGTITTSYHPTLSACEEAAYKSQYDSYMCINVVMPSKP